MAIDMLRQLARLPLPATFHTAAEVDKIKVLRAAGLVIALTPDPSSPGATAKVLAVTEKGLEELADAALSRTQIRAARMSWWKAKFNATVTPGRPSGWR
ncbi:MAG: hypothetical protein JSS56_25355 [Proteobacteria bacterium]|nr:hypothetical protein [Pseudomonadota bacterium]